MIAIGFHGHDGACATEFIVVLDFDDTLFGIQQLVEGHGGFFGSVGSQHPVLDPECEMCNEKESSSRNCSLEFNMLEICCMISLALRSLLIHSLTRMRLE